ncbi:MAG: hypothetical protein K2W82_09875 [Candidatus Obscuribacterales bacterium]|nr:hypothetical protein [Candidatus Obscuribacterales bacterium]
MIQQVSFTPLEQEIIILCAAWDLIHSMVNYDIFCTENIGPNIEVMFNSESHRKLFYIFLADFLSEPNQQPFGLPPLSTAEKGSERTFLFFLRRICEDGKLNSDTSCLRKPVDQFFDWLEGECVARKVWFPSIEVETNIRVKRITFLKICGNSAKHNFARLSRNVKSIQSVLHDNEIDIDFHKSYLVMPEFHDWFYNNICTYHGSAIAEYLNNIRKGIFEYVKLKYDRMIDVVSDHYNYNSPPECQSDLTQSIYWDLMNRVSQPLFFHEFATPQILKQRY